MINKCLNLKTTIYCLLLLPLFIFTSCGSDDTRSCTNCNSPQTQPFEVCEESNGDASVNGEDTGVPFDIYITDLIDEGATCGG